MVKFRWGAVACLLAFCLPQCVLMQVQRKEQVLSSSVQKTETGEVRRTVAAVKSLTLRDGVYYLEFAIAEAITTSEKRSFAERVRIENRLWQSGKKSRFLVAWLSFAFEDEGAGGYALYMLGGLPMTLGINIPVALYDWGSLPFRLRDETIDRIRQESRMTGKREIPVTDCPAYFIRIFKQDFALAQGCTLAIPAARFEELARRHPLLPHFPGVLRYELAEAKTGSVLVTSQVFLRKIPSANGAADFMERP